MSNVTIKTLKEVERYTKAADQTKLARAAMERQAMAVKVERRKAQ